MAAPTPEQASRGGKRGAAVREANRVARAAKHMQLARIVDGMADQKIAPTAYTAALQMMQTVLEHGPDAPIETQLDVQRAAETARIMFLIARLASGESTSNTLSANVNAEDLAARLAALRESPSRDAT